MPPGANPINTKTSAALGFQLIFQLKAERGEIRQAGEKNPIKSNPINTKTSAALSAESRARLLFSQLVEFRQAGKKNPILSSFYTSRARQKTSWERGFATSPHRRVKNFRARLSAEMWLKST